MNPGEIISIKPVIVVAVSLAAVPFIIASGKKPGIREFWTFVAAVIKFLLVCSLVPIIIEGTNLSFELVQVFTDLSIKLRVDAFGILFALVSSFLWIITSAYSIGYMRTLGESNQTRYFAYFAISLSATLGVAFSANLLTLYLFYEILSFATYPLVTHHQDAKAQESGRKYIGYIVGTSIGFVLPAMLYIYSKTGTLEFNPGGVISQDETRFVVAGLLILLTFGFAKVALMPLHSWLPAAMVAPTPVSALLHAVAVVKVGAFCVIRVFTGVFGIHLLGDLNLGVMIGYAASFTIIVASLVALTKDNFKARLAYSTIGQLSYIVLGVSLLSASGIVGSLLHIAMHAFGKITLFFCAGAIYVSTGVKEISKMKGIGKKMPYTMFAFFIGSLSVIGLPPGGGFISKWYLVLGTLEAQQYFFLAVLLVSSVLNAVYFLPIVYQAFFCSPEESLFDDKIEEAPKWCLFPIIITAIGSIILLIYTQPFFKLATLASQSLLK